MRVLVVDDEPEIARLLRESVERLGHVCFTCGDVGAARRIVATEPVDAMALDLGLPGPDPVSWLETLARENPRLAGSTVVITGGAPDADLVARIGSCGADLLPKPFRLVELSRRLLGDRPDDRSGRRSATG